MKIKVFGWLLFFDGLNTKDLLIRMHWRSPLDDNLCVICNEYVYEDRLHFFSTAILVAEFGAIFALTGPGALISSNVFNMLDLGSSILSSLKSCSLQFGIFGSLGMAEHLLC